MPVPSTATSAQHMLDEDTTKDTACGSSLLRRAVSVRAQVTHWKRCGEEALVDREKEQVFTKQRLQAGLMIRHNEGPHQQAKT